MCLSNLGVLYEGHGRLGEAKSSYTRALAIAEKVLGPNHAEVAVILSGLASVSRKNGDVESTIFLERRVAAIRAAQSQTAE